MKEDHLSKEDFSPKEAHLSYESLLFKEGTSSERKQALTFLRFHRLKIETSLETETRQCEIFHFKPNKNS